MKNSISIITYLRNQEPKLVKFLDALEADNFNGELIVVVIGGEDPFEVLDRPRPYSIKALYIEKKMCRKTVEEAKRIALTVAQTPTACVIPVGVRPTKKNILAFLNKKGGRNTFRQFH